jgi:hypothetical protein
MSIDYDQTKKMLNVLRKLNESKTSNNVLREDINPEEVDNDPVVDDVTVINDVEVKILSSDRDDMGVKEEQKNAISQLIDNFRQQVSQIVEFDPGMTVNENQIRLDGSLTDEDIDFVFIAGNEGGLYINSDMLKVEDETLSVIQKLLKFEDVFKTAMEPLITQRTNN